MKKIMIFGTFDGLHEGHKNMIEQTLKLFDNLIIYIVVAQPETIKKIKGRLPLYNIYKRAFALITYFILEKGMDNNQFKVIPGSLTNFTEPIAKYKPDIIALGYDQKIPIDDFLEKILKIKEKIEIIRLKPYKPNIYKSSLLNKYE